MNTCVIIIFGIWWDADMIIGVPDSTPNDVEEILALFHDGGILTVNFSQR